MATVATNAATTSPQKTTDENKFPFDRLMASLSNQDKMAADWRAVVTPTKEKKRKSHGHQTGGETRVQVNEDTGSRKYDGDWKSGNKKKKKDKKQKSHDGGGNGAPGKTKLTKGERKRLRREQAEREALAAKNGGSLLVNGTADAGANGQMASNVKAKSARSVKASMDNTIGTQIEASSQMVTDSQMTERSDQFEKKLKNKGKAKKAKEKAEHALANGEAREHQQPEESQEMDVDVEESMANLAVVSLKPASISETVGVEDIEVESQSLESQIRAQQLTKSQKKKRKFESQEHPLNVDDSIIGYAGDIEVDDAEVERKESKRRKKHKGNRDSQSQNNGTQSVEDVAGQQSNEPKAVIGNSDEVVIQQKTPKPSARKLEGQKTGSFVPYKPVTKKFGALAQKLDQEIVVVLSSPQEKVTKHSQESAIVLDSLPGKNDNDGADDETASASESDQDDNLETTKEISSIITSSKNRIATPQLTGKAKEAQTSVNNAGIPAVIPGTSMDSSKYENSNSSSPQSKKKEKTFLLPASLMDSATIRQEQMASQEDELRNTIIRAKNASPVRPAVISKPRSLKLIKKETEAETSADEGPLANFHPKPKVSPVPPPQPKQLISRPASRTPPSVTTFKKPIKARGGDLSGNDPLSRAVTAIRKDSLSKISGDMFNTASNSNESGSSRRTVTTSATDTVNEKLVLVEDPNWEHSTGKVRARIGDDDTEGEESTFPLPPFSLPSQV